MENFLNALIWLTNFSILPAITYGSQLALGALGITLVFSILRFGNFAHGETMSIGTAFTILFMWLLLWLGGDLFPISLGPIPIPTALIALVPGLGDYGAGRAADRHGCVSLLPKTAGYADDDDHCLSWCHVLLRRFGALYHRYQ